MKCLIWIKKINNGIDSLCAKGKCYSDHDIHERHIKNTISTLKRGKKNSNCNLTTDHLIHGSSKLFLYISFLFKSMINHEYVPKGFLMSKIVPIPKFRKKSANDINNYRGIALSSVLLKVFDKIVIVLHSNVLSTSDVQYGFRKYHLYQKK